MKTWILFFLPCLVFGQGSDIRPLPVVDPAEAGMSAEALGKIDGAVERLIAEKKLVGANVLVMRGGRIIYEESFGMRDAAAGAPMQEDSIFRIYSMTKAITSAAALMLCEEGKLSLDDPVERHLPAFAEAPVWIDEGSTRQSPRSPTVRDLLRHTGGFTTLRGAHPVSRAYRRGWVRPKARRLDRLVANVAETPLLYPPGERWVYGISSDLLAAVVASAAEKPFEEVIRERLLGPLGMVDTAYSVPKEKANRLTVRYQIRGETISVGDPAVGSRVLQDPGFKGGGSGLLSTIRDYARFLQMIANGGEFQGRRYLREDTVDLMRTNQLPRPLTHISFGSQQRYGTAFGLGFAVRIADDERWDPDALLGDYGWGGAASTHYWISPRHDLVVITMEQTMPYNGNLELALKPLIYDAVLK